MEFFFFLISFFASVAGAISGIGGGIIIKPALEALSEMSTSMINFMSGCTVFLMSVVSLLMRKKSQTYLDVKTSILLATGGAFGGLVGHLLFSLVKQICDNQTISITQSAALLVMTIGIYLYILNNAY